MAKCEYCNEENNYMFNVIINQTNEHMMVCSRCRDRVIDINNMYESSLTVKELGEKTMYLDNDMEYERKKCEDKAICIDCGGDASEFKNELSHKEYLQSGLCQKCQDEIFN